MNYLIRVGQFGQIGRFCSELNFDFEYSQKVICRTSRGLEIGEFLEKDRDREPNNPDGELLRQMTSQDELLAKRLGQNKLQAVTDCQRLIDEQKIPVVILDAEQTFDGGKLFFYFAGEATHDLEKLTDRLADTYDAQVRFSEFAETLAQGCGPDCGQKEGAGCHETACSSCGIKSSCKK
ncbi:MAG: PSP1 C-terminal domain-containing protein [Planctomycetota bacterium]|nr:PSP1 C-terminal domain-containing protein [Planctomycetota bacterium]